VSRALRVIGGEGMDPELREATLVAALAGTDWTLATDGAGDAEFDLDAVAWQGLDTIAFPIRAFLSALDHPAERVAYGGDPEQWIDWRRPAGEPRALGVLVHGGFYRSRWRADLMNALGADLAVRGWVSANLEYRRPDRHGWDATLADVFDGILAAQAAAPGLPVVLFGHSAGGQLVLQAVETLGPTIVDLAVSLTGVVDLAAAYDRALGEHAIGLALDGGPEDQPTRYAAADPSAWTERRGAWLLVEGDQDSTDLREMNRRLSRREDLGRPELIEGPGDHFSVIDPTTQIWAATIDRVESLLA
jgi:acetyl esterase/lipase